MAGNTEILLSPKRIGIYPSDGAWTAERRHLYNIRVCESFYPSLAYLEIILRNQIDYAFSREFGFDWLYDPGFQIGINQAQNFQTAQKTLRSSRKSSDRNDLVSELTFGFWTAFFGREYDGFWEKNKPLLAAIFPWHKAGLKINHRKIHWMMSAIRRYRNKIFHYGAIIERSGGAGKRISCIKMHDMICSAILNIAGREFLDEIIKIDRFNTVGKEGWDAGVIK